MTASERVAALDALDPAELCRKTESTLATLVEIMNAETTLLRAGRNRQATTLTAEKTLLVQDYVGLARAIQRRLPALQELLPAEIERLRHGHESLATQMAENLRVIATARTVTETLLSDVAVTVGAQNRTKTYGSDAMMTDHTHAAARGIAINRAL
ncbi:MAG TPA: hypothetical protein VL418_13915 [Devosiaceae bacterium]|nr:hypothetical protein [Devosiaceae bacterium]